MNKDLLVKLIPIFIIVLGTGVLSFVFYRQYRSGSLSSNLASLQVESLTDEALEVLIDGKSSGTTPFLDNELKPGRVSLKLVGSSGSYSTILDLYANTRTVVTRQIGTVDLLSAGEVIWLEPSLGEDQFGLNVVGSPAGAKVALDGREVGVLPFTSDKLSPDEHTLSVSAAGYQTRGLKISLKSGYLLNVAVQLSALPAPEGTPESISEVESSRWSVLDLSLAESQVTAVPGEWAKAAAVWYRDSAPETISFDFFLDYNGVWYNGEGSLISLDNLEASDSEKTLVIGYLGNTEEGVLSESAKESLDTFGEKLGVLAGKKVKILSTGTGWLRVRSSPGLSGAEVTKVDVGGEYTLLEESGTWVKIKIDDETEGWVSGAYVDILP